MSQQNNSKENLTETVTEHYNDNFENYAEDIQTTESAENVTEEFKETKESEKKHHHHSNSSTSSSGKSRSSSSHSLSGSSHSSSRSSSSGSSHSSNRSSSSGSSHHHSGEHEYKVHYGKYNFSVDPQSEDVPIAKYRKISKRKKKKQEEEIKNPKKKRSKAFIIFRRTGIIMAVLLLSVAITLIVLINMGRNHLLKGDNIKVPINIETEGDFIIYKGHKYKFNEHVATILFAGVDKKTEEHKEKVLGTAGQADAIFILAVDTSTKKYKVMALSRDAMVDVNVCDVAGNFKGTEKMQICLSHAYGDGAETSNENLKRSISRLLFGITVDAYLTVDLDVIPILNDDVGGVTVEVIEDLTNWNPIFEKGAVITLHGEEAETYVRARDVTGDENQNNLRMERQKGYIDGFVDNLLSMTRRNLSTPVNLYGDISENSRTDIDIPIITYFASLLVGQQFEADEDMVKIPGETVMGEKYAEFNVDTEGLFDIIIQTYYTRID